MTRGPGTPTYRPAPKLEQALCRGHHLDWFTDDQLDTLRAIMICHQCPELIPCRTWALGEPTLHGIWGALTQPQRTLIRKATNQWGTP